VPFRGDPDRIKSFADMRSGTSSSPHLWYYTGVLRNPLTGKEVAGIEGVEIIQPFGQRNTDPDFLRCYMSQKLFMYVDFQTRSELITQFRVRHHSPLRAVKPVSVFTEKVSIRTNPAGGTAVDIEMPSGRFMTTNKVSIMEAGSSFDRLLGRQKLDIVHFMSAARRQNVRKWISFGPGSDTSSGRSQEYYTMQAKSGVVAAFDNFLYQTQVAASRRLPKVGNLIAPRVGNRNSSVPLPVSSSQLPPGAQVTMAYRRYGECPSWFSVGRSCVIEVKAGRYPLPRGYFSRNKFSLASSERSLLRLPSHVIDLLASIDSHAQKVAVVETNSSPTPLTMKWFRDQDDPLSSFRPWHSYLNPFRREQGMRG